MQELRCLLVSWLRLSPAQCLHSLGFCQRFCHVFKRLDFFLNCFPSMFGAGVRWASENSTESSTAADCRRGLRLNVTLRTVDCAETMTSTTHSDSPGGSTSFICSAHGRCFASKYHDVSETLSSRSSSLSSFITMLSSLLNYHWHSLTGVS